MRTEPLSPERRRKNRLMLGGLLLYFVIAFLTVVFLRPAIGYQAISVVFGVTMMVGALVAWGYFIVYKRLKKKKDE